jgi:hypothetical protein
MKPLWDIVVIAHIENGYRGVLVRILAALMA